MVSRHLWTNLLQAYQKFTSVFDFLPIQFLPMHANKHAAVNYISLGRKVPKENNINYSGESGPPH